MIRQVTAAASLAIAVAIPAGAEEFVVKVDAAYDQPSARLLEALKVSEVESFSENGAHYVILEAPNEAYVEAFFLAIGRTALELSVVDASWTTPAMNELSVAQRLGFLRQIDCDSCTS